MSAELLGRIVAALGGTDRLERVANRITVGRIEAFNGLVGPYRSWAQAPNRFAEEWTVAGVLFKSGFDGIAAWEQQGVTNTPRALHGHAEARAARRARFAGFLPDAGATVVATSTVPIVDRPVIVIHFVTAVGSGESLAVDAATWLPMWTRRREPYEDGLVDTVVEYGKWRRIDDLMLPYRVSLRAPDQVSTIDVEQYQHDTAIAPAIFRHPLVAHHDDPTELALTTVPTRIYKVPDGLLPDRVVRFWGVPHPPIERWLVHVVVRERYGRPLEAVEATIALCAGSACVKTEIQGTSLLRALRRVPASRFFPCDELFHLRHRFAEPASAGIDRMHYTLSVVDGRGDTVAASLDIPLSIYETRTRLRCPLHGPFLVSIGHEPSELSHTYERSQQFACDLVPLSADLAPPRVGTAAPPHEVLAPADGAVVRARDDIPDDMPPVEYLKLADPLYAIGGNGLVLDHGSGEFSMLFHLQHGSIRVRPGDRVRQGDVLGLVGSAGTPGYPHLHYHLQSGADFLAADGLPIVFDNVVLATDWLGPMRRGVRVPIPMRGPYLTTI